MLQSCARRNFAYIIKQKNNFFYHYFYYYFYHYFYYYLGLFQIISSWFILLAS